MSDIHPNAIVPGAPVQVVRRPGVFGRTPAGPALLAPAGTVGEAIEPRGTRRWLVRFGDAQVVVAAQALKRLAA